MKKFIQDLFNDLNEYMSSKDILFKVLSEDEIDFTASDVDFVLKSTEDLVLAKEFILNYNVSKLVKVDNRNQFYVIVIDGENIHAFDLMVGLFVGHMKVCDGEYFFESEAAGLDFLKTYKFLKQIMKHNPEYYFSIDKRSKNGFFRLFSKTKRIFSSLFCKQGEGASIVALGPDGSGKSHVTKFLKDCYAVNRKLFSTKSMYLKPSVFKIKPDKPQVENVVYKPHDIKVYSSFFSMAKVFYIWLNYFLYIPMFYLRKRKGQIILFDRHFYDILIDNERYGINHLGLSLANVLYKITPKPDIVFILTSNIHTLSERKPDEVSLDKLEELVGKYKKFSQKDERFCHIENDRSIGELEDKIKNVFLKRIVK